MTAYDYRDLSAEAVGWIHDLKVHADDTGFPDIDPTSMSSSEVDLLADYLSGDDGSLSEEDQDLSDSVAEEVRNLARERHT